MERGEESVMEDRGGEEREGEENVISSSRTEKHNLDVFIPFGLTASHQIMAIARLFPVYTIPGLTGLFQKIYRRRL